MQGPETWVWVCVAALNRFMGSVHDSHLNSSANVAAYGGKTGSTVATRSTGGTIEPWHMLQLSTTDGRQGSLLLMPPPRRALRHHFLLCSRESWALWSCSACCSCSPVSGGRRIE